MKYKLTKGFLLMVLVFLGANLYAQEKLTINQDTLPLNRFRQMSSF